MAELIAGFATSHTPILPLLADRVGSTRRERPQEPAAPRYRRHALRRAVVDALRSDQRSALGRLPANLLHSGSSKIRNWITLGGMAFASGS
jgi:CO/xanthine dehydrogenase FAD-binding subunit